MNKASNKPILLLLAITLAVPLLMAATQGIVRSGWTQTADPAVARQALGLGNALIDPGQIGVGEVDALVGIKDTEFRIVGQEGLSGDLKVSGDLNVVGNIYANGEPISTGSVTNWNGVTATFESDSDLVFNAGSTVHYNSGSEVYHKGSQYMNLGASLDVYVATVQFNPGSRLKMFSTVPEHSNSAGDAGQVAFDADYIYYCVSDNLWKRVAYTSTSW